MSNPFWLGVAFGGGVVALAAVIWAFLVSLYPASAAPRDDVLALQTVGMVVTVGLAAVAAIVFA